MNSRCAPRNTTLQAGQRNRASRTRREAGGGGLWHQPAGIFRRRVSDAPADTIDSHRDAGRGPLQRPWRIMLAAASAALSGAVSACQLIGPSALSHGRPNYNDVIQRTSAEQILQNIVRVWFQESTFFMEVSEVDAQLTFSGQLT